MTFYNDLDPQAAAWLRQVVGAGAIPDGHIDTRSIHEIEPKDVQTFNQAHFFAGIGGWAEALAIAGFPDDVPVWTGSCPCQPFSAAGKKQGTADKRHLWPEFRRLIAECQPPIVFGEQVAGGLGRAWLAGVRSDLEALGYEVGAADLCAAGVGAPHIRQRIYWGAVRRVAYPVRERGCRRELGRGHAGDVGEPSEAGGFWDRYDVVQCRDGQARRVGPGICPLAHGVPGRVALVRGAGNAIVPQVAAEFVKAFMEAI